MGDKEVPIGFEVTANEVHYYLSKLRLAPHETKAIDLRKLRDAQEPGYQGVKIPAEATDGSVTWIRVEDVPVMGRLVVLQRHRGLASNYDCNNCPCPTSAISVAITPDPGNMTPGTSCQYTATLTAQSCNGPYYPVDVTSSSSWSSSNCPVCTITNGPSSWGRATGVSGGTSTITVTYNGTWCLYDPNKYPCPCTCQGRVVTDTAPANVVAIRAPRQCGGSTARRPRATGPRSP